MEGKKSNHALPSPFCCPCLLYKNRFVQSLVGLCENGVFLQKHVPIDFGLGAHARQGCIGQSKNSVGLLAFTGLLLMTASKSNGWSPFRLETPHVT